MAWVEAKSTDNYMSSRMPALKLMEQLHMHEGKMTLETRKCKSV